MGWVRVRVRIRVMVRIEAFFSVGNSYVGFFIELVRHIFIKTDILNISLLCGNKGRAERTCINLDTKIMTKV